MASSYLLFRHRGHLFLGFLAAYQVASTDTEIVSRNPSLQIKIDQLSGAQANDSTPLESDSDTDASDEAQETAVSEESEETKKAEESK